MLIRFAVSNYLSFGNEAEFNMLTGSPRRFKEHIYHFGNLELLKTAAIYGANGAGKSNLVKAINLLQAIVLEGKWDSVRDIKTFRLDDKIKNQPTSFEIEFIKNQHSYSYGISIFQNKVLEEWLFDTQFGKKDILIFSRTKKNGKTKIEVSSKYFETEEDKVRVKLYEEELLQDDAPLIKMLFEAKRTFDEVKEAFTWFRDNINIVTPHWTPPGLLFKYISDGAFRKFANDFIKSLQTGVSDLEIETVDLKAYFGEDEKEETDLLERGLLEEENEGRIILTSSKSNAEIVIVLEDGKPVAKRLKSIHEGGTGGGSFEFELEEESDGTLRALDFIPSFYKALTESTVVIIDEIDQSIHPALLKSLIKKFVDNTKTKGQFIFTTHESNLLDQTIFRQDEIWFAEKKKTGETTFYPLSDYKFRFDMNIQKGYLDGRFGAIPFLGNLKDLNWNLYAKEEQGV